MSKLYAVLFKDKKGTTTVYSGDDAGLAREAWNKAVEGSKGSGEVFELVTKRRRTVTVEKQPERVS